MLFRKPHIVALIHRNSVELVHRDGSTNVVQLPPELSQNLEVLDEQRLNALFTDFLKKNEIKNKKILIVLDDTVLFRKDIPITKDIDIKNAQDDFVSKVPFEAKNRRVIRLQQQKSMLVIATNQQLYSTLIAASTSLNNKLISVVPQAIYGFSSNKKITSEDLQRLFLRNPLLKDLDFLTNS